MPTIVNIILFVVFAGFVIVIIVRSGKHTPKW
jgi:hypothetical protein